MAKKPTAARSTSPAYGHADAPAASSNVDAMDYPAHEAMYQRFTGMVKWAIVASAVVVIFLFIAIHPMIQTAAS